MPHAKCTKADHTPPAMTTNTMRVPSDRPTGTAVSAHPAAAVPGLVVPPENGAESGLAAEARLAAELAEERHVALELQRAILPLHDEPFDLPGLRTMVRYLPASRAGRVGGDWYITADMPGGHVLIALGDVAGHGLAAAAITGSPPERLVGWLNDLVWHVAPEHTASVVAGYFDPASRTLTWAQAGHPPPVLVRGSWARPLDPPAGILLGAGQEEYAAAVLALAPGDLLLLYSDGLIERRDRSVADGPAILAAAVRGISDPEQAIEAALSALGATDLEDDTCLVAVQVL